jgi:chromosome segregation protein
MANAGALPVFLKAITIQGFKSFADKVKLELGHGLSVVVGPNGSGKSNVADAVRWVLGEQSAKNLRGTKMEDIIFAGSTSRRQVGMAEVSLIFDNSTGIFPLEYREVTITRRVYRDGEGQFFINHSPCRLKDIHELFMDTGAGKEGFSIIGQGRVEEILNLKSEERRVLIEEASGITKYRMRKREALKRLDETEHNLERLEDILTEIEGQLEPLSEQARIAEESLALTAEQHALEIQIVVRDLKDVREKLNLSAQEVEEHRLALAAAVSNLGQAESQTLQDKVSLNQLEERIQTQQEAAYQVEQSLNQLTHEIRIRQEREGYINEQLSRVSQEVSANEEKKHQASERMAALDGRISILQKTVEEAHQKLLEDEKQFTEAKLRSGFEEVESLKASLQEIQAEHTKSAAELNTVKHSLTSTEQTFEQLLSEKKNKENESLIVEEQLREQKRQIEAQELLEKENIRKIEQVQSELKELFEQSRGKQNQLTEMNRELERMNARYHALKNLEDSLEGYQRGVRELMQAKKKNVPACSGLCGTLADLIQVEERYEVAIETALGGGLQNIIAETEKSAKAAVNYLKTHQLGRATFLPLDVIQGGRTAVSKDASADSGFIGLAVDLVRFDEKYRAAFESQLGRILVVTDMEAATRVARASGYRSRIVTLDGDQVHPGGSLSGGSLQRKGGNLLGRSREIQELKHELETRKANLQTLEKEVQIFSERKIELEKALKGIVAEGQEIKEGLAVLRAYIINTEDQMKRIQTEIEGIQTREEANRLESVDLTARKETLEKHYQEQIDKLAEMQQALALKEQYVREAGREAEALQERLMQARIQSAKWEQELKQAEERLEHERSVLGELNQILEQKQQDLRNLEAGKQDLLKEQEELEVRRIETAERQTQAQEALMALRKEREALSVKVMEQERLVNQKRQEQQVLEQKLHALELRVTRWDTEWETGQNRLREEFELSWDEAQTYQTEEERSKLWARVQEVKRQIEALGPINQAAIEEYPKMRERYDFLSTQKQDLVEANNSLRELIGELDKTMSERFEEGFKAVNEAFQVVFKELFNGGFAELRLDDPSNLLETGVEIIAQPPGKKPQLLSLLSGGERALTAIGLLFALLRVKPSPFCILDEIEASLDDANVSRFAQYIHRLSSSTQFLVISHRKGTMESADVLYGISMEESGVSKLLSVKLEGQDKETQSA